jgi:hypothetical protein
MAEVGLGKVAHDTGNMSKYVESSADMARREFDFGCLGVGIIELSILVVNPPGLLLVRRLITSKFIVGTLAPKTDMLLEMM